MEQLRATGHAYLDTQVEKGKQYTYKVRWGGTGKVIFTDYVVAGKENPILKQTELNFNQMSIKAIDSLITGTWPDYNKLKWQTDAASESFIDYFNIYRKEKTDSSYVLIASNVMYNEYLDTTAQKDIIYDYSVSVVSITGQESSKAVSIQNNERLINTTFPPKGIAKVSTANIPPGIQVAWLAAENNSISKIKIYRMELDAESEYQPIGEAEPSKARYWDTNVEIGKKYAYTISTLMDSGLESEKGFLSIIEREEIEE